MQKKALQTSCIVIFFNVIKISLDLPRGCQNNTLDVNRSGKLNNKKNNMKELQIFKFKIEYDNTSKIFTIFLLWHC